jgi:hypothetical protein
MAGGVKVTINDHAIISALNTPGGAIHEWRDEVGSQIKALAQARSPINNPMNAEHRGGEVGTYKAGWDWDRRGSSGHHVVARVTNSADHAIYVEYGRSGSRKLQIFSWTEWGGGINRVGGPTPVATKDDGTHWRHNRPLSKGELAFNKKLRDTLPPYKGSGTKARDGMFILTDATAEVVGAMT